MYGALFASGPASTMLKNVPCNSVESIFYLETLLTNWRGAAPQQTPQQSRNDNARDTVSHGLFDPRARARSLRCGADKSYAVPEIKIQSINHSVDFHTEVEIRQGESRTALRDRYVTTFAIVISVVDISCLRVAQKQYNMDVHAKV